jgi:ATP phosphoribosyltransferase regulatory subunit
VENRGFEYHTGVGFTIFCRHCAGEIGRGGRYSAHGEPAVGATLFMDTLLELLPESAPARRVYLPFGADRALAARLRDEGWVTIEGLAASKDDAAEAKRLRCSHVLAHGRIEEIKNG